VLVIDRNWRLPAEHRYRGRRPQACLKGIIGKGSDNLNVMGFLRAIEGYHEGDSRDVGASMPSNVEQPQSSVKSVGSLLANIIGNFQTDLSGDGS
jgi:hypothetical protein